jgi:chemotaxis protein CheC
LTPFSELTELQWDALRELANIGAGHAATALSKMLGDERLDFQPPQAWTATAREFTQLLAGDASPWRATVQQVRGGVSGELWLVLGRRDAQGVAARLLGEAHPEASAVDGALAKMAQAVGASALAAMGMLTGLTLEASAPELRRSAGGALATGQSEQELVLVLDVLLRAKGFAAQFLFLPRHESLGALLRSLRV